MIKRAFVLAAGLGERMRPLTDTCPKPLLKVAGKAMLDRALDALEAAGIDEVVINLFYLGAEIETHLKNRARPKIIFSREDTLLDTGGGVRNALAHFGDEPFFVLNGDVVWFDGAEPALTRMMHAWNPDKMDMLLLLHPFAKVNDPELKPDYAMQQDGALTRKVRAGGRENLVFAGPRIVKPSVFQGTKPGKFGFLELMDKAELDGKLHGIVHDGDWYHVGTPEALAKTNEFLGRKKIASC